MVPTPYGNGSKFSNWCFEVMSTAHRSRKPVFVTACCVCVGLGEVTRLRMVINEPEFDDRSVAGQPRPYSSADPPS